MGIKTHNICSKEECNPIPFVGEPLEREYCEDPHDIKCPKCKVVKDKTVAESDICPYCNIQMKPVKRWRLKCNKCGGYY